MNYLALLGWNDGTDKEVYSREELIEAFDLSRVTASPAMFDDAKLRWLNGQHLRTMPLEPLLPLVLNRALGHKHAAELVLRAGARGPHGKRPSTREWQRGF